VTLVVAAVYEAVRAVCDFSHQLSETIVFGFATSHTASIEAGQGMWCNCHILFEFFHYTHHTCMFSVPS